MNADKNEPDLTEVELLNKLLALHRELTGCATFEELGIHISSELPAIIPPFHVIRFPVVEGELAREFPLGGVEPEVAPDLAEELRKTYPPYALRAMSSREPLCYDIAEIPELKHIATDLAAGVSWCCFLALTDSSGEPTEILVFEFLAPGAKSDEIARRLSELAGILAPPIETIKLRRAYEDMLRRSEALMQVSQIISGKLELRELLTVLARQCSWLLNADRSTVWLHDEDRGEIWTIVGEGLTDEIRMPVGLGIAGNVAKTQQTLNIADPYSHPLFNPEVDKQTGYVTKSILCMPLHNKKGDLIGVYQVLNKLDHAHFTQKDEELLASLSGSAAVAIENARLYEDQKKQFNSFIEVLASSVDAKDPTTADHSKMVTGVAVALAKELGYPPQKIEFIRVAAVVHDYGKIAIPDAILRKPGRLTPEEFKLMRSHAAKTIEILSRVYFTKEMRDVPKVAGMHHERMDGTGYPLGLKDGEIRQEGRILAVADELHALQERPYKRGFTPREALAECKKLTATHIGRFGDEEGAHLDIEVVDALERILEREDYDPTYFARESGWSDISPKELTALARQYGHEQEVHPQRSPQKEPEGQSEDAGQQG